MSLKRTVLFCLFISGFYLSNAQLEVARLSTKNFSGIGFGAFLNVSASVSDANYVTGEVGLYVFSREDYHIALLPILAGYRYTLDGSGTGFYVEPNVGYSFGASDIKKATNIRCPSTTPTEKKPNKK